MCGHRPRHYTGLHRPSRSPAAAPRFAGVGRRPSRTGGPGVLVRTHSVCPIERVGGFGRSKVGTFTDPSRGSVGKELKGVADVCGRSSTKGLRTSSGALFLRPLRVKENLPKEQTERRLTCTRLRPSGVPEKVGRRSPGVPTNTGWRVGAPDCTMTDDRPTPRHRVSARRRGPTTDSPFSIEQGL